MFTYALSTSSLSKNCIIVQGAKALFNCKRTHLFRTHLLRTHAEEKAQKRLKGSATFSITKFDITFQFHFCFNSSFSVRG